ncbi:glutamine-hydrolyzing carbamoyl-phosphate synthase small subunit [Candidatus Uhrbacteria bacterium]|nr:glutamine-hydrolyzing carbamoyl-phosphate synthase small subunit [Candidatus Uhrbacteria bacterium]
MSSSSHFIKQKNKLKVKGNVSSAQKNPQEGFFFYKETAAPHDLFRPAELILNTGVRCKGLLSSWSQEVTHGEIVFTTGMTGYVETITDPSYAGQVITFTYPLIGNYGVPAQKYWEHSTISARGVIVSEASINQTHYANITSFIEWLRGNQVPLFLCSDTRALTKHIREHGTPLGTLSASGVGKKHSSTRKFLDPATQNLVAAVSITKKKIYGNGAKRIIAVDCGMKENIIRELLSFDTTITRVPYSYDYSEDVFDGIFVSNGPGDPAMAKETIAILEKVMRQNKPIFGICLGSQLLALAAGAKTYKLPYGHRGQNQPCQDLVSGRCYITSQNHGYAVDEKTLPKDWTVSFRNLNDFSVEGVAHRKKPFFSVQFHPEASPGPTDTRFLFKKFIDLL